MRVMHGPKWVLVVVAISACSAPVLQLDAGAADAGLPDAALPPLVMQFVEVPLPAPALRLSLVSDGLTLFSHGTRQGTSQSVIFASDDEGRTWAARANSSATPLAAAPDAGLYLLEPTRLLRSIDGARTFTTIATPASIDLAASPFVSVTRDGSLWLSARNPPLSVERSDDGSTFATVPLPPGTTRFTPCRTDGDRLVGVRNGDELIASEDAGFVSLASLGAVNGRPVRCIELPTGTVLAVSDLGNAREFVRVGSGPIERTTASGLFDFVQGGGEVFRVLTDGRVETSTDDGMTWLPRVASAPTGVAINDLAFVGSTLVALAPGQTLRLPAGATSWEPVIDPGVTGSLIDLSFSVSAPSAAILTADATQRTVFVTADGVTWTRGATMVAGLANAMAMSPDGTQLVLGSIAGTYRVLGDAGTSVVIDDRLETAAGLRDTNPIRALVWESAQGGTFVIASTANDADTTGSLWQWNPGPGSRVWEERRPFMTTTAAAVRNGGYHGVCVAAEAPPPALTRSLVVSMRSFVSTNSSLGYLFTRQPALGSNESWLQDTPPVAVRAPLSVSCNGEWGHGLAVLWPERRLWVGRFANELREVPLPGGMPEPRAARFDRSGYLWLVAGGLWRSTAPLTW